MGEQVAAKRSCSDSLVRQGVNTLRQVQLTPVFAHHDLEKLWIEGENFFSQHSVQCAHDSGCPLHCLFGIASSLATCGITRPKELVSELKSADGPCARGAPTVFVIGLIEEVFNLDVDAHLLAFGFPDLVACDEVRLCEAR